jgi:hypothetical protein
MTNFIFLLEDIVIPENYIQMIVWYLIAIVCIVIFVIVSKRKKSQTRGDVLQEKIDIVKDLRIKILGNKPMSNKQLYTFVFQMNAIRDFCKETFTISQFVVYDEAYKRTDFIFDNLKHISKKNWKNEEILKLRTKISQKCEEVEKFLTEAL